MHSAVRETRGLRALVLNKTIYASNIENKLTRAEVLPFEKNYHFAKNPTIQRSFWNRNLISRRSDYSVTANVSFLQIFAKDAFSSHALRKKVDETKFANATKKLAARRIWVRRWSSSNALFFSFSQFKCSTKKDRSTTELKSLADSKSASATALKQRCIGQYD